MAEIHLDIHLIERLEQVAAQRSVTVNQFLEEAISSYLRQIEQQEMAKNIQAFNTRQAEINQAYADAYVAFYAGELVDHDCDYLALHHRIRERFGRRPVLIRQSGTESERSWTFRSPHFEQAKS